MSFRGQFSAAHTTPLGFAFSNHFSQLVYVELGGLISSPHLADNELGVCGKVSFFTESQKSGVGEESPST